MMTEDEMIGWHHRLDGHEFEQAPGVGDGQGSLSLYFWLISWNAKASYVTQEILAFFLLSLSHHGLRTTRFWSIKGPQHPALRVDSLPAEPQGKPKNTGVRYYPFPSGSS